MRNVSIIGSFIWGAAVCFGLALAPAAVRAEIKLHDFSIPSGRIAFTYTPEKKKSDIYVIDFAKITVTPLYASPADDEYPTWSPDGTRVIFASSSSGDKEIYLAEADGSNLRRLTNSNGVDEDPSWSPDGTQIVFSSARKGGQGMFIMASDGTNVQPLVVDGKRNTVPRWSPRGDEILYSTDLHWPGWDIMLFDLASNQSKLLTSGLRSFCRAGWSPDGSQFAFSYGSTSEIDIYVQSKGGTPSPVTSLPGREYDATWNEDGTKIFFVNEISPGKGDFQLFVLDVASKKVTQLTEGAGSVRHISWTPYPAPLTKSEIEKEAAASSAASPN